MRGVVLGLSVMLAFACAERSKTGPIPEAAAPGATPRGMSRAQPMVVAEAEPKPAVKVEPTAQRRGSLPDATLIALYGCWLESPYPYMFDPPDTPAEGISIPEYGLAGSFMAGIGGIMHYGSLSACMGRLVDVEKRSYSAYNTVERFAGMPVGIEGADWRDPMQVNPAIVRWGRRALIPDPDLVISGSFTARQVYTLMFQRFFRLMTDSYLELQAPGRLAIELDRYRDAIARGTDGLDYLHGRFSGQLNHYGGSFDGTQWTPAMSFGFWLRRHRDGSAEELWGALTDLMRLYDGPWIAQRLDSSEVVPPADPPVPDGDVVTRPRHGAAPRRGWPTSSALARSRDAPDPSSSPQAARSSQRSKGSR